MQELLKRITVGGRDLDVMWVLSPNRVMTAPEIWERLRRDECKLRLKIMIAASCGSTYAAIGMCCRRNWIEEAAPNADGVRRYKLTQQGSAIAQAAMSQMEERLRSIRNDRSPLPIPT